MKAIWYTIRVDVVLFYGLKRVVTAIQTEYGYEYGIAIRWQYSYLHIP
jgi:hypothetical protein